MNVATWAPEARGDLLALDAHYRPLSERYADLVVDRTFKAATFLADHPYAGPALRGEFRKWTLRGTDFLIIYRPSRDGIEVLRIRNARENWWHE